MSRFGITNQAIAIWRHSSLQKKKLLAPDNRAQEAFSLHQEIQQVPPPERAYLTGGRA